MDNNSDPKTKKPVFVIGAGSWGTALALVLARNGNPVQLWDADSAHIKSLQSASSNNRHLPGVIFPENLVPVSEFLPNPDDIENVVVVVPCEALDEVLTRLKSYDIKNLNLCLASKGLAPESLSLNHEIVASIFNNVPVAILSGPSFALEVAVELPTAVTIASTNSDTASQFSDLFHNESFRIYTLNDVIGVQVGGAVKNVMAIAAGISDGLGYGANTRAAVITRGLAEICRLGIAMGGRMETFMGLAGLGDLVLTCTDNQSRNRRLGIALAEGKTLDEARREIGQAIEGVRTVKAVCNLANKYNIDMPISEQIFQLINGDIKPEQAVQALLLREPKAESK
ncbi:MAG: NAD(P)H-dependent glycerol-3-phosphate dehydrogenase [Gammaproteobacteria bacterium]|jgi:glycerol-3-phosphate dehydrogenase (NAD(P)+)